MLSEQEFCPQDKSHEIRVVYWLGDRVIDIMAIELENLKPGKTTRLQRALRALESLKMNHLPTYDKVTLELVSFYKANGMYERDAEVVNIPF